MVTERQVSQENKIKKIGTNNSFYPNWNQFQIFKIARFEFKVTVHNGLWEKSTQLWPFNVKFLT